MLVLFEKIESISTEIVEFYTVKLDDEKLFEFEKFDNKDFPNHQNELQILYTVLVEIGRRGAKSFYFKHEQSANALPKVSQTVKELNTSDFGLRLYCIRLTDNVVVLLNGGIKTKLDPTQCPNIKHYFATAIKIANKLDQAILEKEISYHKIDCLVAYELEI